MSSPLPPGWAEAPLCELVEVLDSQRIPVNANERAQRPGDVPYYGAAGQVGTIDRAIFDEPLILLGEDGIQFFDPFVAKAYLIDGPSWVNNHAHVLRADDRLVDRRYLKFFLDAFDYHGFANGTTRLKLTKSAMTRIVVALPPRPEQSRIAAVLDQQFARLARLESALNALHKMFEALDVAVLERAAQGYLTGDGPRDTPPQVAVRKASTKFDYNSLPPLPDEWQWMRADDVCEAVFNGNTPKAEDMTAGHGEVPFFKVYNIDKRKGLDFSIRPTYVDRATHESALKRSRLRPRDVLINIVGPPMGKVAVVPERFPEANMNQAIVALRPGPGIDEGFLAFILRSPFVLNRLTATSKATAGQFNISLSACRELPLPVPPREEQAAIAAVVGDYDQARSPALADLHALYGRLRALRKSLLREAMAGRLLPQDPHDDPADLLLSQIAEDREAASAAVKKRSMRNTRVGRAPKIKENPA